jgi:hypothetical protein
MILLMTYAVGCAENQSTVIALHEYRTFLFVNDFNFYKVLKSTAYLPNCICLQIK